MSDAVLEMPIIDILRYYILCSDYDYLTLSSSESPASVYMFEVVVYVMD